MVQENNLYGEARYLQDLPLYKLGARARVWAASSFPERDPRPRTGRERREERA